MQDQQNILMSFRETEGGENEKRIDKGDVKEWVAYRLDNLDEKANVLVLEHVVEKPLPKEAEKELKALGYLQ